MVLGRNGIPYPQFANSAKQRWKLGHHCAATAAVARESGGPEAARWPNLGVHICLVYIMGVYLYRYMDMGVRGHIHIYIYIHIYAFIYLYIGAYRYIHISRLYGSIWIYIYIYIYIGIS